MTRVLILNERDPAHPRAGGAEVHVAEIFGRLARRGLEVVQLACSFPGASERSSYAGVGVRHIGELPHYYAQAARLCRRETRSGRHDVVVDCLNKFPFLSPLYAAAPVVALCHHLFGTTAFLQVAWPVAAAVWSAEQLIPRVYRHARFVSISESTRDDLVRRGIAPDRVEVHHPGIRRPDLQTKPIGERPHRIVYLGRLEAYKNVDVLLRAAARVSERVPDLEFVVIGEGSERARLEGLARQLGLASAVRFTGFVSDPERDRLLAESRVCACASAKEGWGLTVVESNAVGTPNVASDAPGLRDSVRDGETGFLVPLGDVEGFADRIGALLLDDALAARLSSAAESWSRRFDWDRAADQMARALECARGAR